MTHDAELTGRVRTALEHVPDVTEKKMFGSTAFLVSGKMCINARAERIMCRIDPALHDAALEHDGCRTVMMKGRPCRGYVAVEAAAVRTEDALKHWVELSLTYNKTVVATTKGDLQS